MIYESSVISNRYSSMKIISNMPRFKREINTVQVAIFYLLKQLSLLGTECDKFI